MHTDARTLDDGTLIEGDLCIVGAGAAGIGMALEWIGSSHRVILLEGGGFDREAPLQDLYRGEVVGQPYNFPLDAVRLHYFGGTTGHWAGFCAPLDPQDFRKRDWVPHSGWPFGREDLDPFYARAQAVPELGPYAYEPAFWQDRDPEMIPLPLHEDVARTKMWQFSTPTRFGTAYRDRVVNAPNVHLYTYANVTEIDANEAVTAVSGLRVKTVDGKEHRVRARYYVLACGAIQNARLLLASNRQAPAGLGNARDLVGRFFMEHFEMPGAQLFLAQLRPMKMYEWTYGTTRARGELALTEAVQRERRILNGTTSLWPGLFGEQLMGTFQRVNRQRLEHPDAPEPGEGPPLAPEPEGRAFQMQVRQEQTPNPASRVTLGPERDALGVFRIRLDWQLTELDKRSIRVFYDVLAREVGRSGVGRMQLLDWLLDDDDTAWPPFLSGGWHHMGTTRMHDDPRQGVVDADGGIHGLGNLFVAGASVFPTSGAPNPTLTLIALALRLSDYLKDRMA